MKRRQVYSGELVRSYDLLKGWRADAEGLGIGISDIIGGYGSTTDGFNKSWTSNCPLYLLTDLGGQTSPAAPSGAFLSGFGWYINNLQLQVDTGTCYPAMALGTDQVNTGSTSILNSGAATGYGDIAAGDVISLIQCVSTPTTMTTVAPGAGNFRAYLVAVVPQQVDTTELDDPNRQAVVGTIPGQAVLPYYNSANPGSPLAGPGGLATPVSQASARIGNSIVQFSANSPQTSAVSMTAAINALINDSGSVPMYIIGVSGTQTAIPAVQNIGGGAGTAGGVWACGLGTAPAITASRQAPFLRGFLAQHHLGVPGSSNKIDGAAEWKPLAAVPNNYQGFTQYSYLQAGPGSGYLTPSTAGAASVVNGAGSALLATSCSQSSGTIKITMETAVSAFGIGANVLCTIPYTTVGAPVALIMTYRGTTQSFVAPASLGSFSLLADATGGTITFYLVNGTNGGIANTANGILEFSYIIVY